MTRVSRRSVILFLSVALTLVGLPPLPAPASPGNRTSGQDPNPIPARATEVIAAHDLWTKSSRTFTMPDGSNRTVMYGGQVNFKDETGAWGEIDNSLMSDPDGAGWRNRANDYEVELPSALADGPVKVQEGRSWVDFALTGADATGATEGNGATYTDAFPGVDVRWEVSNEVVKEDLVLADPSVPSTFVYELSHSDDVTPRANAQGGIDFVRGDGVVPFFFAPPYMLDASGSEEGYSEDVTMKLSGDRSQVIVRADRGWLSSPERQWPVTIDPSVVVDRPYDDVWINSAAPNTVNDGTELRVGPSSDGSKRRALLRFDDLLNNSSPIPADAIVAGSSLHMNITATTTTTPLELELLRVKRAWTTSGATWNDYATGASWQTAGGSGADDVDSSFIDEKSMGGSTGQIVFHPGRVVQRWLERDHANEGVMIKAVDGDESTKDNVITFASTSHSDSTKWPKLTVDWVHRMGERPFMTYERFPINDRQELMVNVANGGAVLKATDLNIASGLGSDVVVERYFNSLYDHNSHSGHAWRLGTGHDVELSTFGPDVVMKVPGHYHYMFFHKDGGGWTTPPGIRGELTESGGVYEFKFRDTDEIWRFSGSDLPRTEIEDRNGNVLTFEYFSDGKLWRIKNNEGQYTSFWYNGPNGELTKVQDWTGRYVQYTFSSYGGTARRLIGYKDAAGNDVTYGYDSAGDITCIVTADNRVTRLVYDSSGRVTKVIRVSNPPTTGQCDGDPTGTGPTWTFSYGARSGDPFNATTTMTDARSGGPFAWDYTHDTEDRVVETEDPLGNVTKSEWTAQSSVDTYTDAAGSASGSGTQLYDFSYNTGNDIEGLKYPSGAESTITHDENGAQPQLPRSYTDEQGNRWNYEYYGPSETGGKENNLKFVCVVPDANASSKDCSSSNLNSSASWDYTYFSNGNLDTIDDAKGAKTRHTYFSDGNLEKVDHPTPLPDRTFTYDSLNRRATMVDGKAQTTTYTYDALDRVDTIEYDDGSIIDYTYDADGNITSRKETTAETLYTFDSLGHLTEKKEMDGSTVRSETAFSYDNVGNLRFLTHDPGAGNENEIEYTYDGANDPDKVYLPGKANPVDFTYQDRFRTKTEFPNGVTLSYTPDVDGNINVLKAGVTGDLAKWHNLVYDRDDGGTKRKNIQKVQTRDASGNVTETITYKYDGMSRLWQANSNVSGQDDFSYLYDKNSNLTTEKVNGTTTSSFTYHPSNQIATRTTGGTTYTYNHDGNGNLTLEEDPSGADTLTLGYNAKDQMTSAADANTSAIALAYSGPGSFERQSKGSTSYVNHLLGAGSETSGGTRTFYHRDPNGQLLSMQRGSTHHFYINDYMNSVLRVVDDTGTPATVARYSYQPYGKTTVNSDTIGNPWRWAGGYHDEEVGLYKFGTRSYRPEIFRFTQQDPKAPSLYDPITLNRWAYAGCDPVNAGDPSGQSIECWAFGIGSAISGLATVASIFLPISPLATLAFGALTLVSSVGFVQSGCAGESAQELGPLW